MSNGLEAIGFVASVILTAVLIFVSLATVATIFKIENYSERTHSLIVCAELNIGCEQAKAQELRELDSVDD